MDEYPFKMAIDHRRKGLHHRFSDIKWITINVISHTGQSIHVQVMDDHNGQQEGKTRLFVI